MHTSLMFMLAIENQSLANCAKRVETVTCLASLNSNVAGSKLKMPTVTNSWHIVLFVMCAILTAYHKAQIARKQFSGKQYFSGQPCSIVLHNNSQAMRHCSSEQALQCRIPCTGVAQHDKNYLMRSMHKSRTTHCVCHRAPKLLLSLYHEESGFWPPRCWPPGFLNATVALCIPDYHFALFLCTNLVIVSLYTSLPFPQAACVMLISL